MSEEPINKEAITEQEVKKIEEEIKKQEEEMLNKVKEETAEKVRKELEQEQRLKELEKQKEELEKKLEEQRKAAEKLKAEQEAALQKLVEQRLKEEEAHRKSIVPPQNNPFKETPQDPLSKLGLDIDNPDPEKIRSIEEASRIAFEKKLGIRG